MESLVVLRKKLSRMLPFLPLVDIKHTYKSTLPGFEPGTNLIRMLDY